MADFTVTVTLSGVVNGKTVNLTHSYTAEDVVHVNDVGIVQSGLDIFPYLSYTTGVAARTEAGAFVQCIQMYEGEMSGWGLENNTNAVTMEGRAFVGNMPVLLYHGETFDGAFNIGSTSTYEDPDEDIESLPIFGGATASIKAIGLFKVVS